MAMNTGVYPVYENKFKVGTKGRASEEGDMEQKPIEQNNNYTKKEN